MTLLSRGTGCHRIFWAEIDVESELSRWPLYHVKRFVDVSGRPSRDVSSAPGLSREGEPTGLIPVFRNMLAC
jgi:hypothetical protein